MAQTVIFCSKSLLPLPKKEARVVSKKNRCGMSGGQSVSVTGLFPFITPFIPCQNHCIIPAT